MTLATELAALAATFPNPAFDAKMAAERTELDTGFGSSQACYVALFTAAVLEGQYGAATQANNAQIAVQQAKLATVTNQVAAMDARIAALQAEYDALVSAPPPSGGPVVSQTVMPGPGAVAVGSANYGWPAANLVRLVGTVADATHTTHGLYASINAALAAAVTGDFIVLQAGTYHCDSLDTSAIVTIQNAPGAAVWFDGSYQVSVHGGSQNMNPNAFGGTTTPWSNAGQPANVYAKAQVDLNLSRALANASVDTNPQAAWAELVMYNPAPTVFGSVASQMTQVASKAALNSPGQFWFDNVADAQGHKTMYVYGNPTNWDMWIGHDRYCIHFANRVTLRGIGFRRYPTPMADFATIATTGASSIVENCWFEDCGLEGLFWHTSAQTIRLNTFLRCGKNGATATNADDSILEYNYVRYCNFKLFDTYTEAGGIKVSQTKRLKATGNDISDNWGHGLWFDIYSDGPVVSRNFCNRNGSNGINYEISGLSAVALIVGNICNDNGYRGVGVATSRNCEIWNNTLLNNHESALYYEDGTRTDDYTGPTFALGPIAAGGSCRVRNNVFGAHGYGSRPLLWNNDIRGTGLRRWDATAGTYTTTGTATFGIHAGSTYSATWAIGMNLTADYNAYFRKSSSRTPANVEFTNGASAPLTFATLGAERTATSQDTHSIEFANGQNPFVACSEAVYTGMGPRNGDLVLSGSFLPAAAPTGASDRGVLPAGGAFSTGDLLVDLLGVPAGSPIDLGAIQATASAGPSIDQQITDGRNILLINRHHLLPNNADYTGTNNATQVIAFAIAAATQGTAAAPRTVDYWPGQSYQQEDELVVAGKNYTTINLHGSTVAPKPTIDLGVCTIPAAGSVDVTSAGGGGIGPWQTSEVIGRTFVTRGGPGGTTQSETMIVGVVAGGVLQGALSTTRSLVLRLSRTALGHSVQPAIAVSGGIPSNYLDLSTFPRVANRKAFTFSGCDHCRLTGQGAGGNPAQYVGAVPDTWNNGFLPTVPNAEPDLAGQAFLGSFGSTQLEVDNLLLQSVWGDVVRIGALTVGGSTSESAVVNMHDIVGDRMGQNALLPVRGSFITMQDCKFTNMGRGGVELVTPSGAVVAGLNVLRNHFGRSVYPCIFGTTAGAVHSATVTANVGEQRPFDVRVAASSYASLPWADWKFDGNVGFTAPISNQLPAVQSGPVAGSVVSVDGVKNLTYTNNVQDFLQVSRSNFMVHVIGEHITGTTNVANNTGAAARAQGKLNGTFTGGIVGGGRVGIPAVGCVFGGAVDDLASGNATPAAIVAIESQFGFKLGGDRVYVNPSQNMDPTTKQALLDANKANNRISVISFNIPTGQNWYTLAANPGNVLQNCCNSVRDLTNAGHKMMVILDHEPDVTETPGNGVAVGSQAGRLQYAALQTAFMTRMKTTAPLATRALCLGGSKLGDGRHTLAQTLEWLPTDRTLIEVVGHDPYNMSQTPGGPSFASLCTNYWRLLSSYGTPGAIFEFGITLSAGGRVAWWKAAMAHLQLHPECKLLLFFNSHVGPPFIDPLHDFAVTELFSPAPGIASAADGAGQSYFLKGG